MLRLWDLSMLVREVLYHQGYGITVHLLITEYKLSQTQQEYGGWNALALAVANNKIECVRMMLELAGGWIHNVENS